MTDEELEQASADAVKFVKRALALNLLCVLVALAVMAIDQGIKRAVLDAAARARETVASFDRYVQEVMPDVRAQAAGAAGAGGSGPVGSGADVREPAAATAILDQAGSAAVPAPGVEQAGVAGGAPGDG